MIAFLAEEAFLNPAALFAILVAVVLVFTVLLIVAIKLRIKFWRGDYEEKLESPEDKNDS